MRTSLVLAVTVLAVVASVTAYTTKYDNIDLDQILGNERLFNKYYDCMLGDTDASCTADGKELRAAIPDALKNRCGSCNEKQKAGAEKVIRHLIKNKPDQWKALEAKYDPTGIYQKQYDEELKKVSS